MMKYHSPYLLVVSRRTKYMTVPMIGPSIVPTPR